MKLIDIAKNIDKSEKNESYVDLEVLQRELDLPVYGYAEQDRLKAFWVDNWYCTDSWVGGRMYFFDDEPVAYSYQQGRKCYENFAWFSQEAAEKVRDFVRDLMKEELRVRICDINEDIGDSYKISFNSEVLDWSMARLKGQPIEFIERVRETPDYGIDSNVKIRVPDTGEVLVIDVKDLDFLFHVNGVQEEVLDDVLADASARSCETASAGKQIEFEKE